MLGGECRGLGTVDPTLHLLELGRRGLDPKNLLSLPTPLPAGTGIHEDPESWRGLPRSCWAPRSYGPGPGWADGLAPAAPLQGPRSEACHGSAQGQGPSQRLGQRF